MEMVMVMGDGYESCHLGLLLMVVGSGCVQIC